MGLEEISIWHAAKAQELHPRWLLFTCRGVRRRSLHPRAPGSTPPPRRNPPLITAPSVCDDTFEGRKPTTSSPQTAVEIIHLCIWATKYLSPDTLPDTGVWQRIREARCLFLGHFHLVEEDSPSVHKNINKIIFESKVCSHGAQRGRQWRMPVAAGATGATLHSLSRDTPS